LQSPPTGGRLNDEGCVGSHGCILSLVDGSLVSEPGYTLSPFYTRFLTPPNQVEAVNEFDPFGRDC
ncbi:MAG: hypothetical protein KGJ88_12875, partial [Verrucomicrobiota bacterium]|nr:hypothetical protein [Verrucomicrobiota bacterium]